MALEARAKLVLDDSQFTKTCKNAESSLNGLARETDRGVSSFKGFAIAGATMAVVSRAISVVKDNLGSAIRRFDTLNKYPVVMKALGYSTKDVANSTKLLVKGIDGLPTSLQDITSVAQQLAPLTGSAKKAAQSAVALNNAFLASGASGADASRGLLQYTQMLSTGKVDLMSYRTLMETMPIALRKVANSFGFTGKSAENDLFKALQSGKITMDQLNDRFIKLNKGVGGFAELAHKNSAGIQTSFENLKNAVVKNLANMLTAIDKGFKEAGLGSIAKVLDSMKANINSAFTAITPVVTKATKVILKLVTGLQKLSGKPWFQALAVGAGTFSVATNGMLKVTRAARATKGALEAFKTGWKALKVAGSAAEGVKEAKVALEGFSKTSKVATAIQWAFNVAVSANPLVLIPAAIAAVVAALVWFFGFTNTGKNMWSGFLSWLGQAWNAIVNTAQVVWNGLGQFFGNLWNGIVNVTKTVWDGLKSFFGPIVDTIKNVWNGMAQFFSGLWQGIVSAVAPIWQGFITSIQPIIDAFKNLWSALGDFFSTLWQGIVTVAGVIWQGLLIVFTPIIQALQIAWQSFSTVIGVVWQGIQVVISTAVAIIRALITNFLNGVQTIWNAVWPVLGPVVRAIWQGIKIAISTAIKVISTIISTTLNTIRTIWNAVWGVIGTLVKTIWNMISTTISTTINVIAGIIRAITAAIKGDWSGVWNAIKGIASTIWNGIKSLASTLFNGIKAVIVAVWNAIKGVTSSIWNGIRGVISSVWNGIKGVITAGVNVVKSIFTGAMNVLKGVASTIWGAIKGVFNVGVSFIKSIVHFDLGSAGRHIMNSFLNGLKAVWNTVKNFVGGIGNWIKKHKGPESYDKRLLIPAGRYIMGGLAQGLKDNFTLVKDQVNNVTGYFEDLTVSLPSVDSDQFNASLDSLNNRTYAAVSGAINQEISFQNKPAYVTLSLGGSDYQGFVDDISKQQDMSVALRKKRL